MKIGQKVICINDDPGWVDGKKLLVKNKIYTVLESNKTDVVVIPGDYGWDKSRFKLIDTEWSEDILKSVFENELGIYEPNP